jgi:ATP-dependent DNA helicase RecG
MNLSDQITDHFRLTPKQKSALHKLRLVTINDLVSHFPYRYEEPGSFKRISELANGDQARIWGRVKKIDFEKTWKKKMNIAYATVEDQTGSIELVWFRQPYIARMLPEGSCAIFSGKVGLRKNKPYIANPLYEIVPCSVVPEFTAPSSGSMIPLYAGSFGISSLWFHKALQKILTKVELPETLPSYIIERYHLPSRDTAVRVMHAPRDPLHTEAAKKRFAFEEVFSIQLARMMQRESIKSSLSFALPHAEEYKKEFIDILPFRLTEAQLKSIDDVIKDFASGAPMNRLLEGDVGSGKTAVAACAAYIVARHGFQATYMAPTEILTRQHFEGFASLFARTARIKMGLLTSSYSEKFPSKINRELATHVSKAQLLKWTKEGEFSILIGTHAIIQKHVVFKNLALAMVDEQHRFGVGQRSKLLKKESRLPHFLSMSATPIPRTLALSIYADLDVSIIDQMPKGRKAIETQIAKPSERNTIYEFVRTRLLAGDQAFVICPRIQEPDKDAGGLEMKSVLEEAKKLKASIFADYEIGIMHGKLSPTEKDDVMRKFKNGETHILVSTSVVEVGVDVPNATIMMIEGADRFGLAQLHQFRGRVGRGEKQSYCFILTDKSSQTNLERLKALTKAKNGFELAEYDLMFRGAGELSGSRQWGISDIGMEALKNIKMVEAARTEARAIISESRLDQYPMLKEKIEALHLDPVHFE